MAWMAAVVAGVLLAGFSSASPALLPPGINLAPLVPIHETSTCLLPDGTSLAVGDYAEFNGTHCVCPYPDPATNHADDANQTTPASAVCGVNTSLRLGCKEMSLDRRIKVASRACASSQSKNEELKCHDVVARLKNQHIKVLRLMVANKAPFADENGKVDGVQCEIEPPGVNTPRNLNIIEGKEDPEQGKKDKKKDKNDKRVKSQALDAAKDVKKLAVTLLKAVKKCPGGEEKRKKEMDVSDRDCSKEVSKLADDLRAHVDKFQRGFVDVGAEEVKVEANGKDNNKKNNKNDKNKNKNKKRKKCSDLKTEQKRKKCKENAKKRRQQKKKN